MFCKNKKSVLSMLVLLLSVMFLCVGLAFNTSIFAKANQAYDIQMISGASLKIVTEEITIEGGVVVENAIRFTTKIPKQQVDDAIAEGKNVYVATIIARGVVLNAGEVNNADDFKIEKLQSNQSVPYVQVKFMGDDVTANVDGDYYVYNACLFNLQDKNINSDLCARSYIYDGEYHYADYDPNLNKGNAWNIASNKIETLTTEDRDGNGYIDIEETENIDPIAQETIDEYNYFAGIAKTITLTLEGYGDIEVPFGYSVKKAKELIDAKINNEETLEFYSGEVLYGGEAYDETASIYEDRTLTPIIDTLTFEVVGDTATLTSATNIAKYVTEITVPSTTKDGKEVVAIGQRAFSGMMGITKVTLPESVTTINDRAFMNCRSLVTIDARNVTTLVGEHHFSYDVALINIILSDELTTVASNSFFNDSIKDEDENVISNKTDILLAGGNSQTISNLSSANNHLLTKRVYVESATEICAGYRWYEESDQILKVDDTDKEHTYSEGVCTKCGDTTILDNVNYTYVAATEGVAAHYVASGLKSLVNVTEIYIKGEHTEGGVTAPVTEVAASAFKGVPNDSNNAAANHYNQFIKKVVIHENVKTLGSAAFMNSRGLETVIAPGVSTVTGPTFGYDKNLTTLVLGNITSLTQNFLLTVDGVTSVTNLYVYTAVGTNISKASGNELLKDIYYYSKNAVCGVNCWNYANDGSIETFNVTHSYIEGVCKHCQDSIVDNVTYTYVAATEGVEAHYVASGLKNTSVSDIYVKGEHTDGGITAPVTEIAERAFRLTDNKTIKNVVVHSNVKTIGNYAFMGCYALETVIAPGVTKLGTHCFSYAEALKYVVLSGDITTLPANSFYDDGDYTHTSKVVLYLDGPTNNITSISSTGTVMLNKDAIYTRSDSYAENTWRYVDGVPTLWEQAQ